MLMMYINVSKYMAIPGIIQMFCFQNNGGLELVFPIWKNQSCQHASLHSCMSIIHSISNFQQNNNLTNYGTTVKQLTEP